MTSRRVDLLSRGASRARALVALLMGTACVSIAIAVAPSPSLASAQREPAAASIATGTLALRGVLDTLTRRGDYCPPGSDVTRPTLTCARREGRGLVPGLGRVTSEYVHAHENVRCQRPEVEVIAADVRFTIEGRGTIEIAMSEIEGCVPELQDLRPSRSFVVVGGSGTYAGATGSGTVRQWMAFSGTDPPGLPGRDTWEGTLVVSGLEFDVTPPTLSGARGKTVRAPKGAKAARVTFRVTAQDAVDGARPVACSPRSGSRFRLGRTVVTCSATDTSGNLANARFAIVVRPRS